MPATYFMFKAYYLRNFCSHLLEIDLQLLHIENAADFNPFLATKFNLVKV